MKHCLRIFSLLSLLVISGCSIPKSCFEINAVPEGIIRPVIILNNELPVLYQASFNIFKYEFSGLIAFRKMKDSDEIRIVFLSEFGVRIMEFSYSDNIMRNTYSIEPLNKNRSVRFIMGFLSMLIETPECKSVCMTQNEDKSDYFCKLKKGILELEYQENDLISILLKNRKKRHARGYYGPDKMVPSKIDIEYLLRSQIVLNKVENAFN